MLDRIDRRLLDGLQRNSSLTLKQLAEIAGVSASAAQRRIKRLRSDRLIVGNVALVDPKKLNLSLFIVQLEIERKTTNLYAALQQWIKGRDEIQQAYNITGSSDFILIVTASSADAYDSLMAEMVEAHPNIKKFTTSAVLQTFKRGLFVPVTDVRRDN